MLNTNKLSFAHKTDGATDLEDLKRRLTAVFAEIEKYFSTQTRLFFVDLKTNNDLSLYRKGDVIVDATVIPGAITIYAYDANLARLTQSLASISGELPISANELYLGDGSNKIFTTQVQFVAGTTQVYKAGLRQLIGTDYTEGTNLKQITFVTAPANLAKIIIDYQMLTTL